MTLLFNLAHDVVNSVRQSASLLPKNKVFPVLTVLSCVALIDSSADCSW